MVEEYNSRKDYNSRATAIRIHFKKHKIKNFTVNVALRHMGNSFNVYIWKTKDQAKT